MMSCARTVSVQQSCELGKAFSGMSLCVPTQFVLAVSDICIMGRLPLFRQRQLEVRSVDDMTKFVSIGAVSIQGSPLRISSARFKVSIKENMPLILFSTRSISKHKCS